MSDEATAADDPVAAIRAWITRHIGGTIIRFEPIARWRHAWEVDLDRDGDLLRLHVRGERGSGLDNRPLRREYEVLAMFEAAGIPVPKLYGWCDAPRAIVMANLPDMPFLGNADHDPQVQCLVEDYAAILADIHRLDLAPFVEMGMEMPRDANAIASDYLDFAEAIYDATPRRPNALIAFCRRWLRGHLPLHRTRVVPLVGDAPQFFHDGRKITALYDLELAKLGDPMLDLASIRLRDTNEPIGDVESVLARYEKEMGESIDPPALHFYTVALFLAVPLIATPALATRPHPSFVEYLSWVLASSRGAIEAVAEAEGIVLEAVPKVAKRASTHDAALDDLVAQCDGLAAEGFFRQAPTLSLALYARNAMSLDRAIADVDRIDVHTLLGVALDPEDDLDLALEELIARTDGRHDEALIRVLHRRAMRQLQLLEDYPAPIVGRGLQPIGDRPA